MQACQIIKERYGNSPGIVLLAQGERSPTEERIAYLKAAGYFVISASSGARDDLSWLPYDICLGALLGHAENASQARLSFPDKIIEHYDAVGFRVLRAISQEQPFTLHQAGVPHDSFAPFELKSIDVVGCMSPVELKRPHLMLETLLEGDFSAYVFAHLWGADRAQWENFLRVVEKHAGTLSFAYSPFEQYATIRINEKIVIDGRPIGANSCVVPNCLDRARVFLHTSTTEGISNAVVEALMRNVPVVLCEDIIGPLHTIGKELPSCVSFSAPNPTALGELIRSIIQRPDQYSHVGAAFRERLDVFKLNQRLVVAAQEWFERKGLPWKGHCIGLLGAVQSKLTLSKEIGAEKMYRGDIPIYPDRNALAGYLEFQAQIAASEQNLPALKLLLAEANWLEQWSAEQV